MDREQQAGIIALCLVGLFWAALRSGIAFRVADGIGAALITVMNRWIAHE